MKGYILYTIFVLYSLTACNAQKNNNSDGSNFVKDLEREIASNIFNDSLFKDTVTFDLKGQITHAVNEKDKKDNWSIVKNLFRDTDFTLNPYNIKSSKIVIALPMLNEYYELKSHKYIYIIGLDKHGKITLVQEVNIQLPPNAPR